MVWLTWHGAADIACGVTAMTHGTADNVPAANMVHGAATLTAFN